MPFHDNPTSHLDLHTCRASAGNLTPGNLRARLRVYPSPEGLPVSLRVCLPAPACMRRAGGGEWHAPTCATTRGGTSLGVRHSTCLLGVPSSGLT
eukprot:COSAG06_NODE_2320_length_7089_cov_5.139628_9_plen_95_part_00